MRVSNTKQKRSCNRRDKPKQGRYKKLSRKRIAKMNAVKSKENLIGMHINRLMVTSEVK
jgi:hypothetical protein